MDTATVDNTISGARFWNTADTYDQEIDAVVNPIEGVTIYVEGKNGQSGKVVVYEENGTVEVEIVSEGGAFKPKVTLSNYEGGKFIHTIAQAP